MKIRVALEETVPASGYDVRIGSGILSELGGLIDGVCDAHRYAVIADATVARLYGERVVGRLGEADRSSGLFTFPAGEANKTRETWAEVSDRMLAAGFGRDAAVLALGGGVTGDLAGFVAATFLRGIPVVQLPTTLLAMIDSSVGGKTGVDTAAGKNLIGSFHQPVLVVADIDTLSTLPPPEIRSGMAEAIKHGAIADDTYFDWMAANTDPLLALDPDALARLIGRSVEIKAGVVGADEHEGGLRKTLNFGHTIGHAVEALSRFRLVHGEAVGIGLVVEAEIGESLALSEPGTADRLREVLRRFGLPTAVPSEYTPAAILNLTRVDKKARAGQVEYSLIEAIGVSSPGTGRYGVPVEDEVVLGALRRCGS